MDEFVIKAVRAAPVLVDPFEDWLKRQHKNGHDLHWLRHNADQLRERWQTNPEDLPASALPKAKPYDRYAEL